MADNSTLPATGDVIATDDIAGVKHQLVKVEFGAADSATQVSPLSGMPTQATQPALVTANWTSATGSNTASSITVTGLSTVSVGLHLTSTMTAGVITFEVSPDNTNWFPIIVNRIDSYMAETTYTLVFANGDRGWTASVDAWNYFRVRLSTVITGSGTASVFIAASSEAVEPNITVGQATASLLNGTMLLGGGTADVGSVIARQGQTWFEINVPGYTTVAYTAGDQVGTLISITNASRVTGSTGWINSIIYHDDDNVAGAIDVLFFNDTLTLAADNAAFAISDADARKLLYIGNITYMYGLGAQRFGQLAGLSIPYFCTGTTLYVALIARTAMTLTGTTTQRIRFGLTRD